MAKVAFPGLGVMGCPMAGHLQAKGHSVTVYNRTAAKAAPGAVQHGGTHADTPRAPQRARTSSCVASATTTTCARSARRCRAFTGMAPTVFVDQHHGIGGRTS